MRTNYRRGPKISLGPVDDNATATAAADVDGFNSAKVAVTLARDSGSGDGTFTFSIRMEAGGPLFLLPLEGDTTVTQSEGVSLYELDTAGAVELVITTIDVETGSFTLTADVFPYSE